MGCSSLFEPDPEPPPIPKAEAAPPLKPGFLSIVVVVAVYNPKYVTRYLSQVVTSVASIY